MLYEEPSESPLEKKRRKISEWEQKIAEMESVMARHEKSAEELNEVNLIINGLYNKLEELLKEDKAMPETDEGWDAWMERVERIQGIYSRIADLEKEFSVIVGHIEEIQGEVNSLARGINPSFL